MYQLMRGLEHMHRNGIYHRDIKPENVMLGTVGGCGVRAVPNALQDDIVKLADMGSCRGVLAKPPYTEYIATRWYRAPECLLTDGNYTYKMDVWSVGCVFFEMLANYPLFPGTNEVDQLAKIHDVLGTPSQKVLDKIRKHSRATDVNFPKKTGAGLESHLPFVSSDCIDLLYGMLLYDPEVPLSPRARVFSPAGPADGAAMP